MQDVLRALNQLVAGGEIEDYAIGGAVGASFYIEAVQTEDVDGFVFVPESSTDTLRVRMFLEGGAVDVDSLRDIVQRHGLADRFARILE